MIGITHRRCDTPHLQLGARKHIDPLATKAQSRAETPHTAAHEKFMRGPSPE